MQVRAIDSFAGPAAVVRPRRYGWRGMTLLELLIILSVVFVALFIALPTMQPSEEEALIERAKAHLTYLYSREQLYYAQNGQYAPLSIIAADPEAGKGYDKRFAKDECEVDGIKFTGPKTSQRIFDIVATLPNGTRYRIDQTGSIKTMT